MDGTIQKEDRRIARTKKAIKEAFALLLSQKDINEITIKDIADTADINRKTFYSYYAGIYELVDEIENEITRSFENAIKNEDMRDFLKNPHKVLKHLDQIASSNLAFYGNLLQMKNASQLNNKILGTIKPRLMHDYLSEYPNGDPEKTAVVIDYIFSGVLEVFRRWITAERKMPLAELEQTIEKVTFTGLQGMLK